MSAGAFEEQTLWQGRPSAVVLTGYIVALVATLVILPLVARFFAGTMDAERAEGLIRVGWFGALILALIELIAFTMAWVKLRSTSYTVTNQRVIVEQGIVSKSVDEIDLRYVDDSIFYQSLGDRLLGIGSVTLISSDKTTPRATLRSIREPRRIRELIRTEAYQASQRQIFTRAT